LPISVLDKILQCPIPFFERLLELRNACLEWCR